MIMDLESYNHSLFEQIKQVDENGIEFWYARDLQGVLEYKEWRNFEKILQKAKEACEQNNNLLVDHFVEVNKMVELGSGAVRNLLDIKLSRYACYLVVMNGDPKKRPIALGQSYFAIKTRERELSEQFDELSEDEKRKSIRNELKEHNKSLCNTASASGVKTPVEFAIFQNKGYQGLYNGMTAKDIHKHKNLDKNEHILDNMGSTELAANLFRATQTEEKLRRENVATKEEANQTHYEVGKTVRETIKNLGGTMPEDLPTPDKSLKKLAKQEKKQIDNKNQLPT